MAKIVMDIHAGICEAGALEPGAHNPGKPAQRSDHQRDLDPPKIPCRGIYRGGFDYTLSRAFIKGMVLYPKE